jgi:hypothetical protein
VLLPDPVGDARGEHFDTIRISVFELGKFFAVAFQEPIERLIRDQMERLRLMPRVEALEDLRVLSIEYREVDALMRYPDVRGIDELRSFED